ncbi:MAG: DNA methyltransferase [Mucilaginibacter sp.]|uniref:DNA methyltransferase n=1 Tax=Mucilaginibacter sp. TaxID=1882438 RepID=UPI00326454B4
MEITIKQGDNIELLKQYPDNYFDSVVTDCPYGLGKEPDALKLLQDWIDHGYHAIKGKGFMGNEWDAFVPQPLFWKEVFRVLKPGGYVLAFFGTRTYDWGTMAIRLTGFEIRDMITWHYGSGFPKSLDVSKQMDKIAGAERAEIGIGKAGSGMNPVKGFGKNTTKSKLAKCCRNCGNELNKITHADYKYECIDCDESFFEFETVDKEIFVEAKKEWSITEPSTDDAKQWAGYGTAIKPATEPICVARKPIEGTVANNILKYGTGGINIDGCRIGEAGARNNGSKPDIQGYSSNQIHGKYKATEPIDYEMGRFPANVIFDPYMAAILDEQTGELTSGKPSGKRNASNKIYGQYAPGQDVTGFGDTGGASRFFYCAKASQDERNAGCEHLIKQQGGMVSNTSGQHMTRRDEGGMPDPVANFHPTVKPISLIRYLQRLVTPKGGKCLDPYAGSGTSGCAAAFEDIGEIVLMEMMPEYLPIIEARTKYWQKKANRERYIQELKDSQTSLFDAVA